MSIKARVPDYEDKTITIKDGLIVTGVTVEIDDDENDSAKVLFAPAGEYKDEQYIPYTDVELIKSIEEEIDKAGFEIIPDPTAPVFTSLTVEQSTIATKIFYVREKDL